MIRSTGVRPLPVKDSESGRVRKLSLSLSVDWCLDRAGRHGSKTRNLKKADCKVDFFFMNWFRIFLSLGGWPLRLPRPEGGQENVYELFNR